MDKQLRQQVKLLIAELYVSNSFLTHTDDWRKMKAAAELLQSLLSVVDDLELDPRVRMVGAQGSGLPQTAGSIPAASAKPKRRS